MKLSAMIGLVVIASIAVGMVVYSGDSSSNSEDTENIIGLVEEYSGNMDVAEEASIDSHELVVSADQGEEDVYDLPEDNFFVSIAPYVDETHPCEIHSLTGCQGEMIEEELEVHIEDADGKVHKEEKMSTEENGFIDLWLPRDQTYDITIEQDGKTVQSEFSSYEGDDTCITTMQLHKSDISLLTMEEHLW